MVAYATIRRTMAELRERGLVVSVLGKGPIITESPATKEQYVDV